MRVRLNCAGYSNNDGITSTRVRFDLVIVDSCLETWLLPTAQGYDNVEFVMDLASSDSLTIYWTPDDVARNCEYDSTISVTDSNWSTYDQLTVSHTAETFTTSGTSTVTGDASTSITA